MFFKAISFPFLLLLLCFRPHHLIRAVSAGFWRSQLLAVCSRNDARVIFHKFKLDHVIFSPCSPSMTLPCLQGRVQVPWHEKPNLLWSDLSLSLQLHFHFCLYDAIIIPNYLICTTYMMEFYQWVYLLVLFSSAFRPCLSPA